MQAAQVESNKVDSMNSQGKLSSQTLLWEFPVFRSAEYIQKLQASGYFPDELLKDVSIMSSAIQTSGAAKSHPEQVKAAESMMKAGLFRQVLFKVQNVEIAGFGSCEQKELNHVRTLVDVKASDTRDSPLWFGIDKQKNREGYRRISTEDWTLERCNRRVNYQVGYFAIGNVDGVSTVVVPVGVMNKLAWLRYRFFQ